MRNGRLTPGGLFQKVDSEISGIGFKPTWNPPAQHRDQLTNAFSGCGVAVGDYENDGLPDLFVSDQEQGGRLYRNVGGMKFEDVTELLLTGPHKSNWATGASWGDINNDGWLDLYVCGFDCPNRLYLNLPGKNGARKFVESAAQVGIGFQRGKHHWQFLRL